MHDSGDGRPSLDSPSVWPGLIESIGPGSLLLIIKSSNALNISRNAVAVTLDDGTRRVLHVSSQTNDKETDKDHYATVDDKRDVFLLAPEMLKRVEVALPDLEKP